MLHKHNAMSRHVAYEREWPVTSGIALLHFVYTIESGASISLFSRFSLILILLALNYTFNECFQKWSVWLFIGKRYLLQLYLWPTSNALLNFHLFPPMLLFGKAALNGSAGINAIKVKNNSLASIQNIKCWKFYGLPWCVYFNKSAWIIPSYEIFLTPVSCYDWLTFAAILLTAPFLTQLCHSNKLITSVFRI